MTVMYQEYFGLKEPPFSIAPDPRYLFMSEQHREALAHLNFGISSNGGFLLLTGDVGTGKTTVSRCFLEQVPQDTHIAFVLNPRLTVEELLAVVCDELGISYPQGNMSNKIFIDRINEFLLAEYAKGKKTVLIIEEAQNLSREVLEQLRLLTNLETNQAKLLQIILLGQPELRDMLRQPGMSQLEQRVTARFHLGPLSLDDLSAYITHRLTKAGCDRHLFPASLMPTLYQLSSGVPRLINLICDRALLGTYAQGRDTVDRTTLRKAAAEVLGQTERKQGVIDSRKWLFSCAAILIAAAAFANMPYKQIYGLMNRSADKLQNSAAVAVTVSAAWPEEKAPAKSEEMAFQELFRIWGSVYEVTQKKNVCVQASKEGLQCLKGSGDIKRLMALNRPVVMKLFDSNGNIFYGTLKSVKDGTATIIFASREIIVSVGELERKWLGEYVLFWKTPPYWRGGIGPTESGKGMQWLVETVSKRPGAERLAGKKVYDEEMMKEIRKFQLEEGLLPDGIVGVHTVIHLNSKYGSGEPLLSGKGKGGA